jgi:hypothetical protein
MTFRDHIEGALGAVTGLIYSLTHGLFADAGKAVLLTAITTATGYLVKSFLDWLAKRLKARKGINNPPTQE